MQGVRMSNDIKENLTQQTIWLRGLYMLMFALFYSIAELVLFAVVVFQFLFNLFKHIKVSIKVFGQFI